MSASLRMLAIGLAFLDRAMNKPTDGNPGKVSPPVGLLKGDRGGPGFGGATADPSARSVPPVMLGQGEYRRAWPDDGAPSALERAMASGGLLADGPCCPGCGAPMDYSPETCIESKRGVLRFPPQWVCGCGAVRDL